MDPDDMPGFVAKLDQLGAFLGDFAGLLHGYYIALVSVGFEPDQALMIVITFQQSVFPPALGGGEE